MGQLELELELISTVDVNEQGYVRADYFTIHFHRIMDWGISPVGFTLQHLLKSMKGSIGVQFFNYEQLFQSYQKDDFVLDFMQSSEVLSNLKVPTGSGGWSPIGIPAKRIEVVQIPCTITSMTFFDRLQEEGIVRESGHLVKCFDDFYEGFTISDELRKMLLLEDSDNYTLYEDNERDEFLFRLFKHLCLGGAVCQFEDFLEPYLESTKSLYKELLSVQKDPNTKELKVLSLVFKIKAWDKDDYLYYPSDVDHEQSFAYLIVDPLKRHIAVLYHKFGRGVF